MLALVLSGEAAVIGLGVDIGEFGAGMFSLNSGLLGISGAIVDRGLPNTDLCVPAPRGRANYQSDFGDVNVDSRIAG